MNVVKGKCTVALFFTILMFAHSVLFAQKKEHIFKIVRNKNSNIFNFDVILRDDDTITIDAYWIMNTEHGQRKKMSLTEKKAYGYTIKHNIAGHYDLILTAVPSKIIKIVKTSNGIKAIIKINEKEAYLSTVYIFAKNDFIMPKVLYYTITGEDICTGAKVTEKINLIQQRK
ncbi:MAG: DUF4833 domain-containing protein [Endomicrobium sp.]|jgi:hypothetical protein|nr:DUF4833 domain-containing protein [Endomicrobium sp.]